MPAPPCPARTPEEQVFPAGIPPAGSPILSHVAGRNQSLQRAVRDSNASYLQTVTLRDVADARETIRFMVPFHAQSRKGALHEPGEAPTGFGLRWLPVLRSSTAEGGAGN